MSWAKFLPDSVRPRPACGRPSMKGTSLGVGLQVWVGTVVAGLFPWCLGQGCAHGLWQWLLVPGGISPQVNLPTLWDRVPV